MAQQLKSALTILRRKQLESRLGLKRTSVYLKLDPGSRYFDPDFPRPIALTSGPNARAIGWIEAEVDAYIQSRIDSSRRFTKQGDQK